MSNGLAVILGLIAVGLACIIFVLWWINRADRAFYDAADQADADARRLLVAMQAPIKTVRNVRAGTTVGVEK